MNWIGRPLDYQLSFSELDRERQKLNPKILQLLEKLFKKLDIEMEKVLIEWRKHKK